MFTCHTERCYVTYEHFIPGKAHFRNLKFKWLFLKWTIKSIAEKEAYSGFVKHEASTMFGVLIEKKNTKLRI